ncbi:QDE-2-interacting protein [Histoplasma capsulatum G186AR]|uniref:QDE-2-interacting protein n=1 Tax=Ajellomyces capsulatus (strain G186AR / H82 / ATCC MYA-2454 / RMSCC 2432) TaxID=447093 RepID=C0NW43_AJECG|nr:QDE-2-interacting protein [Histoplasma capsulatum G186AR]EEH04148.1 QDE-2-interacting protein [Histoplasma capsulatum G186AR]
MDMQARLKILFDGEDEELLKTNTDLQSVLEIGTLSMKEQNNFNTPDAHPPETSQESASKKVVAVELSSSEDGFDEYLSAFSEVARKNKRKKKICSKNDDNKSQGRASLDLSTSMASHDAFGATLCGNGGRLFCPISAVSRFPYKYIRGNAGEQIAQRFFNEGKFWNRSWDIYYIHPPPSISTKPLILVPGHQVQGLIDDINSAFNILVAIPSDQELGFLIPFENDGTPQPQYLGISSSQEQKEEMESSIPDAPTGYHEPPEGCSAEVDRSFAAFKAKIAAAVDATRRKNKATRKKREVDRIQKLQGWCRAMKRTQCYLGMRPRRPRNLSPPTTDGLAWEEQKRVEREYALACGIILLPLDVSKPAPFRFASEPIFVCVDVEANEKIHHQITEIGISTLDTLDLVGIPPGECGRNWTTKIRSRHFRISEYANVVNKEYVSGCPDNFEFGESEWISISEAADVVDGCFQAPYSANTPRPPKDITDAEGSDTDGNGEGIPGSVLQPPFLETEPCGDSEPIPEHKTRPRNLIFVGHNTDTDLGYLGKLGCKAFTKPPTITSPTSSSSNNKKEASEPAEAPNFIDTLDTSVLFRVLKRETEATSLGKILVDLGITGWNLHNGGNDARYTMEAMIGITFRSRLLLDNPVEYKDHSKMPTTNDWPLVSGLRPRVGPGVDAEVDGVSRQRMFDYDEEMRRAVNAYDRKWKAEIETRVKASVKDLEARVRDECASWDDAVGANGADGLDVDGGEGRGLNY